MKFYFAGAIRGGREKVQTFIKINEVLKKYGQVLDEHVANPNVHLLEKDKSYSEIFHRDTKWISICDMVVSEVSTASLGVGWECCYAQFLNIPVIALCDKEVEISAMIGGNPYINTIYYDNDDDLIQKLDCKIKSLKKEIKK